MAAWLESMKNCPTCQGVLRLDPELGPQIQELSRRVIAAAQAGATDALREALMGGPLLPHERGLAVGLATEGGRVDCLRMLLEGDAYLSDEARSNAIWRAVQNRQIACLRRLLANGAYLSEEDRSAIVFWAKGSGTGSGKDCVLVLLEHGDISEYARGEVVNVAAGMGDMNYLRAVLPPGAVISEAHRRSAIKKALKWKHRDCAEYLGHRSTCVLV